MRNTSFSFGSGSPPHRLEEDARSVLEGPLPPVDPRDVAQLMQRLQDKVRLSFYFLCAESVFRFTPSIGTSVMRSLEWIMTEVV